jgi:metal-sulfur cluster biosynthetic enzyme
LLPGFTTDDLADRGDAMKDETRNESGEDQRSPSGAGAPNDNGPTGASPADAISAEQVKLALRKVKDPELGLNIVDLGLVYDIAVDANDVHVDMTLTSPGCPAGPQIMTEAERVLQALAGVGEVEINLVWSPFWTPERIEPRVRAYMGL